MCKFKDLSTTTEKIGNACAETAKLLLPLIMKKVQLGLAISWNDVIYIDKIKTGIICQLYQKQFNATNKSN